MGIFDPISFIFSEVVETFIKCHQSLNPYLKEKYLTNEEVIQIIERFKKIYNTQSIKSKTKSDNIKEETKVIKEELNALNKRKRSIKDKIIQINISTTKLELKGISFEFKNITDFNFININDDSKDILNALEVFTLQLNAKDENLDTKNNIKNYYKTFISFSKGYRFIKDLNLITNYRIDGKKIFFDFINNNDKCLKEILDLGINIFELFDFKFLFISGIDSFEFFTLENEELFSKAILFHLSYRAKTETINYICEILIKLIEEKTTKDLKLKKIFEKLLLYLKFIKSFLSFSLNFEISNKELSILKYDLCNCLSVLKKSIEVIVNGIIGSNFEFYEFINFDEFSINIIFPRNRRGFNITLRLPKYTQYLNEKYSK